MTPDNDNDRRQNRWTFLCVPAAPEHLLGFSWGITLQIQSFTAFYL